MGGILAIDGRARPPALHGGAKRSVDGMASAGEQVLFRGSARHMKDLAAKPNEACQPSFPKLV